MQVDPSNNKKTVVLQNTKVAVYWRTILYLVSAAVFAYALVEFTSNRPYEAMGNVGLALIFAGLSFRSKDAAVMAYCANIEERDKFLKKLRIEERKNRPWVGWMVRTGWLLMLLGVVYELFGVM